MELDAFDAALRNVWRRLREHLEVGAGLHGAKSMA
jgi:hypothetical protein